MSIVDTQVGTGRCVVCGQGSRPLLSLTDQPIYQHPVPAEASVPEPHIVDLTWIACVECAHAWQPVVDQALLERIYRSHYYTPAPDGIAAQFRNDFLDSMERFGLLKPRKVILEIGASNGDALAEVKARTGASRAYAFEPNAENAAVARQRGLDVYEEFFGRAVEERRLEAASLLYARHVIEHVFEFDDFFAGLRSVSTEDADLVLETPSLDFHSAHGSIAPFHIEHIHVFSLRSLAKLASIHGWSLQQHVVTADGNLIAVFNAKPSGAYEVDVSYPSLDAMSHAVETVRERLRTALADRKLIFWGAGSASVKLVCMLGREPEYWTDSNPSKVGKRFVGLTRTISSPERTLEFAALEAPDAVLVIASSFAREILPRVRDLGWRGRVVDMTGSEL